MQSSTYSVVLSLSVGMKERNNDSSGDDDSDDDMDDPSVQSPQSVTEVSSLPVIENSGLIK